MICFRKLCVFVFVMFLFSGLFGFSAVADGDFGEWNIMSNEDATAGSDSGHSGLIEYENVGTANNFEVSTANPIGLKSFKVVGATTTEGYWNISNNEWEPDLSYMYSVNFTFYCDFLAGGNEYHYLMFYDEDDVKVVDIRIATAGAGNPFIVSWYDGGYQNLYQVAVGADIRYYMIFTHNGTNMFNIKVLSSAFVELSNDDYAGCSTNAWSNFSYIHLTVGGNDGVANLYFDDLVIDLTADDPNICDNIVWVFFTMDDGYPGIHNVSQGSSYGYTMSVFGDPGVIPYLYIYNPSDILVYTKVFAPLSSEGFANYHFYVNYPEDWVDGTYRLLVTDYDLLMGSVCGDYFYEYEDFVVGNPMDAFYYDMFYNVSDEGLFAEFQYLRYDPAFVGDSVDIVYFMPNNSSASNIMDDFYYCIVLTFEGTFNNYMFVARGDLNRTVLDDFSLGFFHSRGTYQLLVYNCSDAASRDWLSYNWVLDYDCVYKSRKMKVYGNLAEYENESALPDADVDDGLSFYEWMAGFGLVIGFACAPIFLFKDNNFAQRNGLFIMILFALVGLFIANHFELLPFWIVYLIGIICVVFMSLSIYRVVSRS